MLQNMKGQFAEHLLHAGFVSSPDPKDFMSNVNSGNSEMRLFQLQLDIGICQFCCVFNLICLCSFAIRRFARADNEKLIKAVIVAGLYPKVAKIRPSFSKKRPG